MIIHVDVSIDTTGVDNFEENFHRNVENALEKTAQEGVLRTMENIENQGLVKTGFLRDSVGEEKISWQERRIRVGAYYGIEYELGTKRAARPFLTPAMISLVDDLQENIAEEFGQ